MILADKKLLGQDTWFFPFWSMRVCPQGFVEVNSGVDPARIPGSLTWALELSVAAKGRWSHGPQNLKRLSQGPVLYLHDSESECLPQSCTQGTFSPYPAASGKQGDRQEATEGAGWIRAVALVDGEQGACLTAGSEDGIWRWPGCGVGWSRALPRPPCGSPLWEQCKETGPDSARGLCVYSQGQGRVTSLGFHPSL